MVTACADLVFKASDPLLCFGSGGMRHSLEMMHIATSLTASNDWPPNVHFVVKPARVSVFCLSLGVGCSTEVGLSMFWMLRVDDAFSPRICTEPEVGHW